MNHSEKIKNTHRRIIEAISSDGCPLCALLIRDELDSLYQWVGQSDDTAKNSKRIEKLLDAGGFCNYHFWRFQKISSPYGISNVGAQLIEKLLEIARKGGYFVSELKHRDKILEELPVECPLCLELRTKQEVYLKELLVVLKHNEDNSKYENSCGLCVPHYMKIVDYVDDDLLMHFLYVTELGQLEKIKADAAGFVSKRWPPHRWEQTEDEKKSYFRAIEKIVGRNGLK